MEVEAAFRRTLLADPTVAGYVAGAIWRHSLRDPLDGGAAVVIDRVGGWADPTFGHGEFPLVRVEAWSDSTRDTDGAVLRDDCEDRAWALWRVIDHVLHAPHDRHGTHWGTSPDKAGLMVVDCRRAAEPYTIHADDGRDTSQAAVVATYAATVVHPAPGQAPA